MGKSVSILFPQSEVFASEERFPASLGMTEVLTGADTYLSQRADRLEDEQLYGTRVADLM